MARLYDLEEHWKSLQPQVSWCWGPQLKSPSWECSLLDTSAGSSAPVGMRPEGRGEASGGKKLWDRRAWMFAQAHSTLTHSPGSRLSLRLWLQVEPELGMKRSCHLVEISCNSNLPTRADWHLQFKRQLMTAALRKGPGEGTAEMNSKHNWLSKIQFQRSIFLTSFKERKKKNPNGHRTRCSASLIITGVMPINMTSN